jgi:dTDP-glucose 4,6-dehydratase
VRIIVTGGLGFIGSAVVRRLIRATDHEVVVLDAETYAATRTSVATVADDDRYDSVRVDIADAPAVQEVFEDFAPEAVMHLAAESHVDRSIDGPSVFVQTNVVGTYNLLEASRALPTPPRLLHVSTDEVFGSLGPGDPPFDETTPYDPRSPYSATKAASDHLARAWGHTFDVPVVVTNCSNNYGPYQFPEKLIPLMIIKALAGEELPVYGAGENVRDWLHVEDHAAGLVRAVERGEAGRTYLFGGAAERSNLEVVETVCDLIDQVAGPLPAGPRRALIRFVTDRPGHDFRYAVDASSSRSGLGWEPEHTFRSGIEGTVRWYLDNRSWWEPIVTGRYRGDRLGRATGPTPSTTVETPTDGGTP